MTETKSLKPIDEVRLNLSRMGEQFKAALPAHVTVEKFMRVALTAIQNEPRLLTVDRQSLYSAVTKCAQDGLLADSREAALVIFGNQAAYLPMIAGLMKKARNSGEISKWSLQVVKEKDDFDFQFGDDERITHKPALSDRGKTIGAYSIVTLKDGEKTREWMNLEEIEAVRSRSRAKASGPWMTDFDEMAKKTVARRHSKRLPMSTDLEDFMRQDDSLVDLNPPTPATAENAATAKRSRLESLIAAPVEEISSVPATDNPRVAFTTEEQFPFEKDAP